MTEVVVAFAVIAIVTGFALVRVTVARDQMRLTNTARDFASYTERARLDSVRRHGDNDVATSPTAKAYVTVSATSYTVFADHDYNGVATSRTFDLPEGITISNVDVTNAANVVSTNQPLPITISFDWHGRSASGYRITFVNTRQHESLVGVTRAGEVSLDRKAITLLAGSYGVGTGSAGSVGPNGTGIGSTGTGGSTGGGSTGGGTGGDTGGGTGGDTGGGTGGDTGGGTGGDTGGSTGGDTGGSTGGNGNGNGNGNGGNGNGNGHTPPTATPTPTPVSGPAATPTPTPAPQCTMTVTPSTAVNNRFSLHNGGTTQESAEFTVTLNNAPTGAGFTVSAITQLQIVVSGSTIRVTTRAAVHRGDNNRGNFTLRVTPSAGCGSAQNIYISVAR